MKNNCVATSEIANFLVEHQTKMLCWARDMVDAYIDFYKRACAFGVIRYKGVIIGVGLAKPISSASSVAEKQTKDKWALDQNGDTLFIDEVVATERSAIPLLWTMMVDQLGERPYVAGVRHGQLRFWDFNKYNSKMNLLLQKG